MDCRCKPSFVIISFVLMMLSVMTSANVKSPSNFNFQHVTDAAVDALLEPTTLVPSIGAALFAVGDFDEEASDWARDEHPIMGRRERAQDHSYNYMYAVGIGTLVICGLSSCNHDTSCGQSRLYNLAAASLSGLSTNLAVESLKRTVDREKPNHADSHTSFPSGHSATSFSMARSSSRCIEKSSVNGYIKSAVKIVSNAAASISAWSRVEAERHYPSDILAGAAIGNFLTDFVFNLFEIQAMPENMTLKLNTSPRQAFAEVKFRF